MPSPDLYEKVGFNDLQVIERMYEGDDQIKREDKKLSRSNMGSMMNSGRNSKSRMSNVGQRTPEELAQCKKFTKEHYRMFFSDELENFPVFKRHAPFLGIDVHNTSASRAVGKS